MQTAFTVTVVCSLLGAWSAAAQTRARSSATPKPDATPTLGTAAAGPSLEELFRNGASTSLELGSLGTGGEEFPGDEMYEEPHHVHPLECHEGTVQKELPGKDVTWAWCETEDGVKEGLFVELRTDVLPGRGSRRLRIETNFSDGVPSGPFVVWDADTETVLLDGTYEAGEPVGEWLRREPNGMVAVPPGTTSP